MMVSSSFFWPVLLLNPLAEPRKEGSGSGVLTVGKWIGALRLEELGSRLLRKRDHAKAATATRSTTATTQAIT